jgi:hypothetical protein
MMFVIIGINRKIPVGGINLANGGNIAPVTICGVCVACLLETLLKQSVRPLQ